MKIQNINSVVERDWIRNKVFLISAAGVEHKVPASQNVTAVSKRVDKNSPSEASLLTVANSAAATTSARLVSPSIKLFASAAAFKDVTNIHNVTRDLSSTIGRQAADDLEDVPAAEKSKSEEVRLTQTANGERRGSGADKQKSIKDSLGNQKKSFI